VSRGGRHALMRERPQGHGPHARPAMHKSETDLDCETCLSKLVTVFLLCRQRRECGRPGISLVRSSGMKQVRGLLL